MSPVPDEADMTAMVELLRVLGHDNRLRLLGVLAGKGEKAVGELEALAGIGQPALSQQLAILRKAQLVTTRREAKQVYYMLAGEGLGQVAGFLSAMAGGGDVGTGADAPPSHGSAATFARIL